MDQVSAIFDRVNLIHGCTHALADRMNAIKNRTNRLMERILPFTERVNPFVWTHEYNPWIHFRPASRGIT